MKHLYFVLLCFLFSMTGCATIDTHSRCIETKTETIMYPMQLCSGWTQFGGCTSYMTVNQPITQTICVKTVCNEGFFKNSKGECVNQLDAAEKAPKTN